MEQTPQPTDPAETRDKDVQDDRREHTAADEHDAEALQADPAAAACEAEAAATVEAILFAGDSPLTAAKIATAAELPPRIVKQAVKILNARYAQIGAAFRIEAIAGGYQMMTLPEYHDVLVRLLRTKSESKLSQPAMETMAIVAYRQPILRADVEAIRGVACGEVLRGLMEKGLAKIVGRAEVLGRPMLYGTTRRFLEVFGLASLSDLPRVEELRNAAAQADKTETKPPANSVQDPTEQDPTDRDADDRDADAAAAPPEAPEATEALETKGD